MRPDFLKDKEGIGYFTQYLSKKGFTNITTTHQHTSWDIEADWKDQRYYFELKRRPKVAIDGKWNDTICELHKLKATPDIEHSYIVNLFYDKMTIIPMTTKYEIQHKLCQKTNDWDNHKVMKDLCSFKNEEKYLYDYD